MIKKIIMGLFLFFVFANINEAKDILQFDFPNSGWHSVDCQNGIKNKTCYASDNDNEMLTFQERIIKNEGLTPTIIMQKQLGKDKNNYKDINPKYVYMNENDVMVIWCSELKNVCEVKRAFQGNNGIIIVTYIDKMPHYSHNMFGQWSNILAQVSVYNGTNENKSKNLIELD